MVEVQLMLACTTLGYIRQFLAHAAPKILGSSKAAVSSAPTPPKHSIITIGGGDSAFGRRRKNQRYNRFGEDSQYALDTFVEAGKKGEHNAGEDTRSETGILQTKTLDVSIERKAPSVSRSSSRQ
jgi:hypothetical protein